MKDGWGDDYFLTNFAVFYFSASFPSKGRRACQQSQRAAYE